ncbi:MAG: 5,10-methylenetetrahydrofolate reductase [Spirochaeta sp.]|nr:5,10-methylenetetrahydrofolate reductase [Spirochaeta sp.]
MSFSENLASGKFLVTTDVIPPKGVSFSEALARLDCVAGKVDAVNVVDLPSSAMRVSPLPVAVVLKKRGFEPILQMTCRDRNRLALQADLLGACMLGIKNILALTGDEMDLGDDPAAKPVFDLDSIGLLKAAAQLEEGRDLAGNALTGSPAFCAGAAVDPFGSPVGREITRMRQKVEAGAKFFQTQPVFDAEEFGAFMEKIGKPGAPVLGGILLLKSARMARFMNENIPGVEVPRHLIQKMENTKYPVETSVEIAGRLINEIKGICSGVHIMNINWEDKIPLVLEAAGLT